MKDGCRDFVSCRTSDDVTPISKYYDVNVKGMQNTLAAMEANGVKRIVFTSSVAGYG